MLIISIEKTYHKVQSVQKLVLRIALLFPFMATF